MLCLHRSSTSDSNTETPRIVARRVRRRYIAGLCLIAILVIFGQVAIHSIIGEQRGTADIVNLSGRQRMLSQKITKAALSENGTELAVALEDWSNAHETLTKHAESTSETIHAQYKALDPYFDRIAHAANEILTTPEADHAPQAAIILLNEGEFLTRMNTIVGAHAAEGEARIKRLDRIEFYLGGATLLVLLIESLFIFEPMVRRLRRNWESLQESEDRFRLAVEGSCDAIWDWNLEANTLYLAPRFAEMVGAHPDSVSDNPAELLSRISSQHLPEFNAQLSHVIDDPHVTLDTEIRVNHADGSERWMLCRAAESRDKDGHATRLVGSLADITELKQSQAKLRELAERDTLTGLANRKHFSDKLELCIARRASRPDTTYGVMFLDFDRFKMINDSLGHSVGDGLLKSFASRIGHQLPDDAVIARFGGDEFAVLMECESAFTVLEHARALIANLGEPHYVGRHEIISTASIGLVLSDMGHDSAETMLRDADIAMYEAKQSGRAKLTVFDGDMHKSVAQLQRLEAELTREEVIEQMHLEYQPIINTEDGSLVGFESLVRWNHPTEGSISPSKFIPIAEECGAIDHIGTWILQTAFDQLIAWDMDFPDQSLRVTVNVSRKQLINPAFLSQLSELGTRHPLLIHRLVLEVTETAVVDERIDVTSILAKIRDLNFPIAMDDFGTGYSSLSCLHNYPLSYLKIDRSFVMNLETRREFTAVFAAIVSLANALDLSVVAEGVENMEQLVQLQAMGCEMAQGYLFSRPLSAADATEYIESPPNLPQHGSHRQAA